jgi:hypothetical protein
VIAEAWHAPSDLELAWVGDGGTLHWARLSVRGGLVERAAAAHAPGRRDCQAAALLGSGLVAGVAGPRLHWYRAGRESLQYLGSQATGLEGVVVAAFPCRRTGELVLIRADGWARRLLPAVPQLSKSLATLARKAGG